MDPALVAGAMPVAMSTIWKHAAMGRVRVVVAMLVVISKFADMVPALADVAMPAATLKRAVTETRDPGEGATLVAKLKTSRLAAMVRALVEEVMPAVILRPADMDQVPVGGATLAAI